MERIPEAIKPLLFSIKRQLQKLLGSNLFGIYVFGSLSYGTFNANNSDIDCVVVTKKTLTRKEFALLDAWHKKLLRRYKWARYLEMPYVAKGLLISDGKEMVKTPLFFYRKFFKRTLSDGSNPITWLNIKERGIVLFGPSPKEFVPRIERRVLENALHAELCYVQRRSRRWANSILYNQVYGVLTLCRILYTAKTGSMTSKTNAARWCRRYVSKKWRPLIDSAIKNLSKAKHEDDKHQPNLDDLLRQELPEFMKYVGGEFKKILREKERRRKMSKVLSL